MSFTRFLVYANDLRIEGLVATTSTWQRTAVRPIAACEDATHNPRVRVNGCAARSP